MSIEAIKYVESVRGLGAAERCVLWDLANHHNAVRGASWPSVKTLAARLRLTDRRIYQILDRLEAVGHIGRCRVGRKTAYKFPLIGQCKTSEKASGKPVSICGRKPENVKSQTLKGEISETAIRKEPVLNLKIKSRSATATANALCKTENLKPEDQNQAVEIEGRRRLALSESRRLGIRDYSTHPVEAWEGQLQPWEIQKRKQMQRIGERNAFRSITRSELLRAVGPGFIAK